MKYGLVVYHQFMLCFRAMPLCAIIRASYGDMLALHGGISPELNTLYEAVLMAGKQRGAAAAAAAGTFLVIQHTYRESGENLDRQVSRFHMY